MDSDHPLELTSMSAAELAEQVRLELRELLELSGVTQESLADVLGYATQGSVSKILNGTQALPPDKAVLLDKSGLQTRSGHSFAELAHAVRRTRRRPDRQRTIKSRYGVFLASPMASAHDFAETRDSALALARKIEDVTALSVYYAGLDVRTGEQFDSPDVAFAENIKALQNSRYFVLYLPQEPSGPSSVWVEAGMALAMNMDSTYFVQGPKSLPYILNRAIEPANRGGSGIVAKHWLADNPRLPFNLLDNHREAVFRHKRLA